jgi:hypothetical protein
MADQCLRHQRGREDAEEEDTEAVLAEAAAHG